MQTNGTEVGTEVAGNTYTATGKARAWFVTILNPKNEDINKLKAIKYKYLIYQHEVCPTTGTPHIHAVLYYQNPVVWPKRYLPEAHIEKVGYLNKCIEYCSKEETRSEGPFEFGERPQQGRRTDLEEIAKEYLKTDEKQFVEEHADAFIRHYKGLRELKRITQETHRDRNKPPTVIWLWGLAGTGKTRKAVESHSTFYIKDGTNWWDGYEQQEAIIIDDFDGKFPYRDLLRLLDRYPYQGQIKGGYVKINSPYIYITCEYPPEHYWIDNELEQITRRLKSVELIGNKPEKLVEIN